MAQGLYDYLFYDPAFFVFFVAMVWGAVHSLSIDAHPERSPLSAKAHRLVGSELASSA